MQRGPEEIIAAAGFRSNGSRASRTFHASGFSELRGPWTPFGAGNPGKRVDAGKQPVVESGLAENESNSGEFGISGTRGNGVWIGICQKWEYGLIM